jgi:hypothetical protein
MLELLAYLRANRIRTPPIVSGGWVEFMRPWTEPVYGILPERKTCSQHPAPSPSVLPLITR